MRTPARRSPPILQGNRVTLVPLDEEALDAVRRWRSDPAVTRYWITQAVPTDTSLRAWLDGNRAAGALLWLIHDQSARPIGYVTLFNIDQEHRKAEVALMIGERTVWGQGYGRAVLRRVLRYAFQPAADGGLGLHKVWLTVFAEHLAARRLYAACGFREDGILRDDLYRDGSWHDQLLMSVLAHEFTEHDSAHEERTEE